MLLVPAAALLLVGAGAFAAALRLSLTGTLLAAYVFASVELVLMTEALSPFHAIGQAGYLALGSTCTAAQVAFWARRGRPLPLRPPLPARFVRRHPLLIVLGAAVAIALVAELALAIASTPNEWDSMTYHLSRVAAWYQHRSLTPFASHTGRETVDPANAEIQQLFTVVFTGSDRFTAIPQFVGELVLLVGIFGTARRLGFARANAAFASLLFATLSEVVLQSTTPQNDLVVSAYLLLAVYFVLGRRRGETLLAAVALALAVGTKLTAAYALPVLVLLAVWTLPRRQLAAFCAAFAVAFAAVGAFVYAENAHTYGSPLGPRTVEQEFIPVLTAGGAVSTAARILWRFVDLSGLDANVRVRVNVMHVGTYLFRELHIAKNPPGTTQWPFNPMPNIRANEDVSFFGLLGPFLLVPLALGYAAAGSLRRTSAAKALLALSLPAFVVELALTYRYAESIGRFFVVPVALCAALAARVYSARLLSGVYTCLGIAFLAFALLHSERKPIGLDGSTPIWHLDRPQAQALAYPKLAASMKAIDAIVPQDARVGYHIEVEQFDYPLYGRRLQRRLVFLPRGSGLRVAERLGLQWVVYTGTSMPSSPRWRSVEIPPGWYIAVPRGSGNAETVARYVRTHVPRRPAGLPVRRSRAVPAPPAGTRASSACCSRSAGSAHA